MLYFPLLISWQHVVHRVYIGVDYLSTIQKQYMYVYLQIIMFLHKLKLNVYHKTKPCYICLSLWAGDLCDCLQSPTHIHNHKHQQSFQTYLNGLETLKRKWAKDTYMCQVIRLHRTKTPIIVLIYTIQETKVDWIISMHCYCL